MFSPHLHRLATSSSSHIWIAQSFQEQIEGLTKLRRLGLLRRSLPACWRGDSSNPTSRTRTKPPRNEPLNSYLPARVLDPPKFHDFYFSFSQVPRTPGPSNTTSPLHRPFAHPNGEKHRFNLKVLVIWTRSLRSIQRKSCEVIPFGFECSNSSIPMPFMIHFGFQCFN